MLRDELSKLPRTDEYCFPEQAAVHQARPDNIGLYVNRLSPRAYGVRFLDTNAVSFGTRDR